MKLYFLVILFGVSCLTQHVQQTCTLLAKNKFCRIGRSSTLSFRKGRQVLVTFPLHSWGPRQLESSPGWGSSHRSACARHDQGGTRCQASTCSRHTPTDSHSHPKTSGETLCQRCHGWGWWGSFASETGFSGWGGGREASRVQCGDLVVPKRQIFQGIKTIQQVRLNLSQFVLREIQSLQFGQVWKDPSCKAAEFIVTQTQLLELLQSSKGSCFYLRYLVLVQPQFFIIPVGKSRATFWFKINTA